MPSYNTTGIINGTHQSVLDELQDKFSKNIELKTDDENSEVEEIPLILDSESQPVSQPVISPVLFSKEPQLKPSEISHQPQSPHKNNVARELHILPSLTKDRPSPPNRKPPTTPLKLVEPQSILKKSVTFQLPDESSVLEPTEPPAAPVTLPPSPPTNPPIQPQPTIPQSAPSSTPKPDQIIPKSEEKSQDETSENDSNTGTCGSKSYTQSTTTDASNTTPSEIDEEYDEDEDYESYSEDENSENIEHSNTDETSQGSSAEVRSRSVSPIRSRSSSPALRSDKPDHTEKEILIVMGQPTDSVDAAKVEKPVQKITNVSREKEQPVPPLPLAPKHPPPPMPSYEHPKNEIIHRRETITQKKPTSNTTELKQPQVAKLKSEHLQHLQINTSTKKLSSSLNILTPITPLTNENSPFKHDPSYFPAKKLTVSTDQLHHASASLNNLETGNSKMSLLQIDQSNIDSLRQEFEELKKKLKKVKSAAHNADALTPRQDGYEGDLRHDLLRYRVLKASLKNYPDTVHQIDDEIKSPCVISLEKLTTWRKSANLHTTDNTETIPMHLLQQEKEQLKKELRKLTEIYKTSKKSESPTGVPLRIPTEEENKILKDLYHRYTILKNKTNLEEEENQKMLHSVSHSEQSLESLKQEKKRLQIFLQEYQQSFYNQNGRNMVSKEERSPVEVEYNRYKFLKNQIASLQGSP
ncbi:hypothetical protein HK098_000812 [Nowakowskiella sp. JEL0407]|nr:hypothetical protein HK098_000812 [Nowakowskiella sp. JEL0407]